MGRWKPDAVGRLARAALSLFETRGFERTTVAEIAAAAGLTESTFFRNFTDKREVLFAGFPFLERQIAALILDVPHTARPVEALKVAMVWLCTQFQADQALVRQRLKVIAASPELTERERTRHAALAAVMGAALHQRGLPSANAYLLAEAAMSALRLALQAWLEAPVGDLDRLCLDMLGALCSDLHSETGPP